jgi:hypothetical protein
MPGDVLAGHAPPPERLELAPDATRREIAERTRKFQREHSTDGKGNTDWALDLRLMEQRGEGPYLGDSSFTGGLMLCQRRAWREALRMPDNCSPHDPLPDEPETEAQREARLEREGMQAMA